MKRRLFKTLVAVLAIAAAAAGPVRGQTTYNVTFGGFAEPAVNTTVSVASLPQTINFYPSAVISNGSEFISANVTSGGDGKVSVNAGLNQMAITISGTFEGTATIHVVCSDSQEYPISCDITVACAAPPVPITVRMAAGTEEAANWSLASGNASVQGDQVLENVMSGSQVTATYNGTQKVKSVKAVKYVAPVLVSSIVLDKQTANLAKDSTMTLTASVLPENAADKSYTWSSDNTSVATVNQNGVVTGHNAGTANIIATANDGSGVKDTCVVTVLRPAILDGVTVLYASDYDLETWSTVMGYNPGLMYQDGDDVRLTSNGAILFHDGHPVDVDEFFYPTVSNNEYQWMRVTNIDGADFYYHQGETWQQAIDADRQDNFMWSIEGGQVKNMMQTLVDSNYNPVDPAATIDPSTVNYHLWSFDN